MKDCRKEEAPYENVPNSAQLSREKGDPILALRGVGKDVWNDEEPDAYVRRLRW
jgi:hypothetical protein